MLIIPIINKNEIISVQIEINTITKVHKKVNLASIKPNDIVVSEYSFLDSVFNIKNQDAKNIVEFIRNISIHNQDDFFISTKFSSTSPHYDLYQIEKPPKKVTNGLDKLYGSVLLDLKNEIPENTKGKYIDLEKMGVVEHITDEKLELLEYMATALSRGKENNYQKMIVENNLEDLLGTLEFIQIFNCRVIREASIDVESYERVLTSMKSVNSKEGKDLSNLYDMAKNNKEAYDKIAKLYSIVYNEPLKWIHSEKDKVMIKTFEEKGKETS